MQGFASRRPGSRPYARKNSTDKRTGVLRLHNLHPSTLDNPILGGAPTAPLILVETCLPCSCALQPSARASAKRLLLPPRSPPAENRNREAYWASFIPYDHASSGARMNYAHLCRTVCPARTPGLFNLSRANATWLTYCGRHNIPYLRIHLQAGTHLLSDLRDNISRHYIPSS